MTTWDERFRTGAYPTDPDPAALLERYVRTPDQGRALDVAAGTGRNAVFLARQGWTVHAVDRSREGLRITRRRADDRGVADRLDCVQADPLVRVPRGDLRPDHDHLPRRRPPPRRQGRVRP